MEVKDSILDDKGRAVFTYQIKLDPELLKKEKAEIKQSLDMELSIVYEEFKNHIYADLGME